MIKEDYVSFEVAKLLKEKGFDELSIVFYDKDGTQLIECYDDEPLRNSEILGYARVTQSLALKWLREVHKFDIDVCIEYKNSKKVYYYSILKKTVIRDIDCLHSETNFSSYEQAVEASLLYVLKNLI
jgi:hypothetical protein